MWELGVAERHPVADHAPVLEAVINFSEIDGLLFQGPPEPLDQDVVNAAAVPIHRDAHPGLVPRCDPGRNGDL